MPDPQKDVQSQAATARVEDMGNQEPAPFDAEKFKADVKRAVEGMAPPATLEEADDFKESGLAAQASQTMRQIVSAGQQTSQSDIKTATDAPPDPAGLEPKPVSDMVNDERGTPVPTVGANAALPGPRPDQEIDLSGGPAAIEGRLTEAGVTEQQLAESNEREFGTALEARQRVKEHAEMAPGQYRLQEEALLAAGRPDAEAASAAQLQGMHAVRTSTLASVLGKKEATKTEDQTLRERVHQSILDIHAKSQTDVQDILSDLDATVESMFTSGEKAARDGFEQYVDRKMREYKADRYSGWLGRGRWLKDKFFDLPDEVNEFYVHGRKDYLAAMDQVIERIAATVGSELGAAQQRIENGRQEVQTFVDGLPDSVRAIGEAAAEDLEGHFDQLAADVDAKRDELVNTVARKYVESRDALDTRIKELQEANKGLVSKAIDAVVGVLKTIYELGQLLLKVLLKAASAISDILAHPIRFLANLVEAIKGGLDSFVTNIGSHLQNALMDLLFGELGSAITMPKQLDFAGILDIVLQVIGITYANIRERLVKRFGEPAVARMEKTVDVFKTLLSEGVTGLWSQIQEKVSDLEDLVIGKIKEFVVERVIKAGIGYIVALLNPAAAFIKACQGIYQIVMFIVERAKQIAQFVESVLDSISAIAQGNVGGAIARIENALASGLTLAIGFLARLANLGALSEKVRSIIAVVRKPVTRAVDAVVFGAANLFRSTVGPALAFVDKRVKNGKDFLKGRSRSEKDKLRRAPETEELPALPKPAATTEAKTDPIPEVREAGPGPLVVHEEFSAGGYDHDLYTGSDGKELILASSSVKPVSQIMDKRLATLNRQYLAARARYDAALDLRAKSPPRARTGWTTLKKKVNEIVGKMVVRLRHLGIEDSPGISAPGLGVMSRHGEQTTKMRKGPRVWWLESEHMMPFAVGKMAWDAVGELVPKRGGSEDLLQTTMTIYKAAADEKTHSHDLPAIAAFKSQYTDYFQPEARRVAKVLGSDTGMSAGARREMVFKLLLKLFEAMGKAADSSTAAAKRAVVNEHGALTEGYVAANGERRGEAAALPQGGRIDQATNQQKEDVVSLIRRTVGGA